MNPRKVRLLVLGSLAVVLAAVTGIVVLVRSCDAPPPARVRDSAPVPTAPSERPTLPPRDKPGPGPITLEGGVYDAAGQAVPGVEISAEFELGPGVHSLSPSARGLESDAGLSTDGAVPDAGAGGLVLHPVVVGVAGPDGAFKLVGLVEGRYRLRVDGPEIFPSEVRFFDVPASGVRLVVARKVSVHGTVVDSAGVAAADVAVSLSGERGGGVHTTRTDASGAFSFEELQEGVFQVWAAREDQAAPALRVSRLGPGPFDAVQLTLGPGAIVTGRVVNRKSNQGVAAAVTLGATDSDEPTRYALSAPDGTFRIAGVPLGRWSASAYAPGYVATEAIDFAVGGAFSPVIKLTPGAVISGRVVNGQGVAVAGAVVSARGQGTGGRKLVFGEHAETLRLRRASGLPAPGADMTRAPGSLSDDPRFIPRGELGVLLGPIPYPPPKGAAALRIAQTLRQSDDQATPELAVRPEAMSSFVTDEQGRFRLAGLDAGTYRLLATHAEYADALSRPLQLGLGQSVDDVRIVMVPGVVLVGTVTNQRDEVIVGATIVAEPMLDKGKKSTKGAPALQGDLAEALRLQAVTGLDGQYRLGPISANVEMRVTAVRHGDAERTIRLGKLGDQQEERTEDFVLTVADATLAGRVRDPVGFPVRGAVIEIVGRAGKRKAPNNLVGRQATSDDNGRFAMDWLAPGPYRLKVMHSDFPAHEAAGETGTDVELTLPFGGGIEGEVRDAHTSQPIAGALVSAKGPGKATAETAAKDDGGFTLLPLIKGAWTLEVSAPGYVPHKKRVDVAVASKPGEVTARDVRVELARGATVAGTVRDANGVRVRGAKVHVGEVSGVTDEEGGFRLRDVPAGDVVITAERGGVQGTIDVALSPGDELVTLEIHLEGTPESGE